MQLLLNNLKTIILAVTLIALAVVVVKNYQKIKNFLLEVKTELSKVAWSTRQELISSTIVVIAVTAIMAVFIGVIDIFLSKFLSTLFK
jgi:preprotein translocase subunit SecE